jgi:hypothetical protein
MNFPINGKKATQAIARLIEKSGGPVDYLRIAKLVYLADRASLQSRGIPIVGGHYYSMRKGPTIGEIMDFVGNRNAPGWEDTVSPRFGNEIRLQGRPSFNALSDAEMDVLDATVKAHSSRTTQELVAWCHENCPEYEQTERRRTPIQVETILKAGKKSPRQIQKVIDEAKTFEELDRLLT